MAKKLPWMCKHNHPMSKGVDGRYSCRRCISLLGRGKPTQICRKGHLKAKDKACLVCAAYRKTPWLKTLDQEGSAQCDQGHHITHDTLGYSRTGQRYCAECRAEQNVKARAAYKEKLNDASTCRKGLHPKTEPFTREGCPACARDRVWRAYYKLEHTEETPTPDYVDWVVVERLLSQGSMQLYDMKRGDLWGPTDGEKWVAYCTYVEIYGEPVATALSTEYAMLLWKKRGELLGFQRRNLFDILGSVGDPEYRNGVSLLLPQAS